MIFRTGVVYVFLFSAFSIGFGATPVHAADPPEQVVSSDDPSATSLQALAKRCLFKTKEFFSSKQINCKVEKISVVHFDNYSDKSGFVAFQSQAWTDRSGSVSRHFSVSFSNRVEIGYVPFNYESGDSDNYELIGQQYGVLGSFIVVEGISGAAGRTVNYYVYSTVNGNLVQFDASSWMAELGKSLPAGFTTAGPTLLMDFGKGLSYTNVRRASDSFCCPTGGSILVELAVRGLAFVIVRSHANRYFVR